MKKKKILHIVEDLRVGGLERVIAAIVTGLDPSRYEVHVWCLARGGDIADELLARGIPLQILNMKSYHSPGKVLRLSRLMASSKFVLVHTHGYFAGTFGRMAALLARIPAIVSHAHSTYDAYKKRNLLIERFLSLFTDRVICVCHAVQKSVVERAGISPDKTMVIYNGPDIYVNATSCEISSQNMRQSFDPGENTVFIIIATLTANKGHDVLMKALQSILQEGYKASLIIVGDGPLKAELKNHAIALSIQDRITFAGQQLDVGRWLQISDVLIAPSLWREGLPLSLIEAMAFGLPVIGSNLGGIPELIDHRESGLLSQPGDLDALVGTMRWMIEHENERRLMGLRGRQKYERQFTAAFMIQCIDKLYQDILETMHAR